MMNNIERDKEILETITSRIVNYLLTDKEIVRKTIDFLIEEKEFMNDNINDIIYLAYNGRDLTEKELNDINRTRKSIEYIYKIIDKLESGVYNEI